MFGSPASRLVGATLALVACDGADGPPTPGASCAPEENFLCGRPRNIAHRGGAALAPEATLPAFENAVAIGADILEMDARRTADGVVVLMHDASVDRTTDGSGAVIDMTFAELQQLDAGYHFTPDDGATYPFRGTGVTVATLDEVLSAFPDRYFMIEIKDDRRTVPLVLAMIESRGLADRVVLASFYDEILADVRVAAPEIRTSMSLAEQVAFSNLTEADEPSYSAPGAFLQPPLDLITDADIARAHRHGLVVHVWTVNDRLEMSDLLARGVDGIITDDPMLLRDVIAAL